MSKSDDAVVVGRASPAFSADEDIHNPSVDGLGTSWGGGAPEDGFIRYYTGEGNGEGSVTGCGTDSGV